MRTSDNRDNYHDLPCFSWVTKLIAQCFQKRKKWLAMFVGRVNWLQYKTFPTVCLKLEFWLKLFWISVITVAPAANTISVVLSKSGRNRKWLQRVFYGLFFLHLGLQLKWFWNQDIVVWLSWVIIVAIVYLSFVSKYHRHQLFFVLIVFLGRQAWSRLINEIRRILWSPKWIMNSFSSFECLPIVACN